MLCQFMGGCASRPKDLDTNQEPIHAEDPTTPNKDEGENEENGGETKKEEPSVDASEPAQVDPKSEEPCSEPAQVAPKSEEPSTEPKQANAEASSEEAKPSKQSEETAKPTEHKVEAVDETKEEEKKVVEEEEGEKEPKEEVGTPNSRDKSDAPLVTL
ncbi:unnamed protein product [Camellia sinensis]